MIKKIKDCTVGELVNSCTGLCSGCQLFGTVVCSHLSDLENAQDRDFIIDEEIDDDDEFVVIKKDEKEGVDYICDDDGNVLGFRNVRPGGQPDNEEIGNDDKTQTFEAKPDEDWYKWRIDQLEKENVDLRKLVCILLNAVPGE